MAKAKTSVDQKIQESIFTDKPMDRETLKKFLLQDMRSCLVFMNEILAIPAAIEALTDVYFDRYKAHYEKKNQVPDPEGTPDSLSVVEDPAQIKMPI